MIPIWSPSPYLGSGKPWVDVTLFGAVGDGVADDTAAIQAAVNAVSSAIGGDVYFPSGSYKVSATITVPSINIRFFSAGRAHLIMTAAAFAIFTQSGAPAATINLTFERLNLKGDGVTAGQVGFDVHDTGTAGVNLILRDTTTSGLETSIYDRGILAVLLFGGGLGVRGSGASLHYTGPGGNIGLGQVYAVNSYMLSDLPASGGGGIANRPTLFLTNCALQWMNSADVQGAQIFGCQWTNSAAGTPTFTFNGNFVKMVDSILTNNHTVVMAATGWTLLGVLFNATNPTRNLDITAGGSLGKAVGCQFAGATSEAVRNAAQHCRFTTCGDVTITETGGADFNSYIDCRGFAGTLLGANNYYGNNQLANRQGWQLHTQTELLTIAAAATSDSTANLIPLNAIIFAVSVRVTVAIPTAATFTVTGTTSGTQFDVAGGVAVAVNTTDVGTRNCPFKNGAAQKVRITPNINPGTNAGRVRITVQYFLPVVAAS
jgi:hypothetical protein